MGSGKVIKSAIEKYGIDNFKKDILEFFEDSETMYAREKEIVTHEFLLREDTYNLRRGGTGGFDYINSNQLYGFADVEVARRGRESTNRILQERYGDNWRSIISKDVDKKSNTLEAKLKAKNTKIKNGTFGDTSHMNTPDCIEKKKRTFKNKNHQKGEKNSNYGKMWIHNPLTCISILVDKKEQIPEGWVKGRKIKPN